MLWHIDPSPYILRNYAPLETRADALANALSQVPRVTRDLATHLATGEAARPVLDAAIDSYQGMAEFYERDIAEAVAEPEGRPRTAASWISANWQRRRSTNSSSR